MNECYPVMRWNSLHIRTKTFLVVAPIRAALIGWACQAASKGEWDKLLVGFWLAPESIIVLGASETPWLWLVVAGFFPVVSYIIAVLLAPWFDKSLE